MQLTRLRSPCRRARCRPTTHASLLRRRGCHHDRLWRDGTCELRAPVIFCYAATRDAWAMHARPRFLLPQPPPLGPLAAYSSPRFAACTQDDVGARPSAGTALLLLSLCSLVGTVLIGIAGSSRSTRCRLQAVRGEAQLREQVVEQQARRQQARGSEAARWQRWQRWRDVDMSAAQRAAPSARSSARSSSASPGPHARLGVGFKLYTARPSCASRSSSSRRGASMRAARRRRGGSGGATST